eukprot:TRINITY_DN9877_c0_g1_i1.p1 TRINITY_DN9877_c0_g1~~TRINITY_DN9877_c0_g1_i1.p1  ORF type:complete len:134 (+),score=42.55 TRINITY_DN9877_c0_g1_i1:45-404(+)
MARGVRSKTRKGLNTLKRRRLDKAEGQRMARIAKKLQENTGVDVDDLNPSEMAPISAVKSSAPVSRIKVTQLADDDMLIDTTEKPSVRGGGVQKPAYKFKKKQRQAAEKNSTRRSAKFY